MTTQQPTILARQKDPEIHALLRAMSVSHKRAQRLDLAQTVLSLGIAASSLAATFVDVATALTIIGALWAVIYSVGLVSWADNELRRAAVLQEMLDVRLFRLPWNPVIAGDQVGHEEINRLSTRYRGRQDMIEHYYEVPDLPAPYDVVACQQQNLGWGIRVRRRYAYVVLSGVVAWSVLGVVIGAWTGLTVGDVVLRWYVPSLGAILLGLDIFRSQRDVAEERGRALRIMRDRVRESIRTPGVDLAGFARQVQDVIYLTRQRTPRVPDWFFLRYRAGDRADFKAMMDELAGTLATRVP
ncbi:hypothetical protein HDA40_001539 [Hamadaea flava]|uniref:S-4TM family putative pore-forming effector n=1 Tax=Hamadaea flava TaxID=1742688 RepID=UPI0036D3A52C|nr:hypothetical protein [Hamadaea flava]